MLQFSWGNPISWLVGPVTEIDNNSQESAITTGTITGFLALHPEQGEAHASVRADMTYVGAQPGRQVGQWMWKLPAMTKEFLDPIFRGKRVWLVMERTNAKREVIEVQYKPARSMVLAA